MTMLDHLLARIFGNELLVFVLVMVLMLAFAELGFRLGVPLHTKNDAARKGQIGGVQAPVKELLRRYVDLRQTMQTR